MPTSEKCHHTFWRDEPLPVIVTDATVVAREAFYDRDTCPICRGGPCPDCEPEGEARMRIVAVDPGKVTGIATWTPGRMTSWQEPTWYAVDRVWQMLADGVVDVVVCESYTITASTLRKTRGENWSLESIGALRWMCRRHGVEFILQAPADAMRFADDRKLKAAGWYQPTPGGHQNDAARHLLTYLAATDREMFLQVIKE